MKFQIFPFSDFPSFLNFIILDLGESLSYTFCRTGFHSSWAWHFWFSLFPSWHERAFRHYNRVLPYVWWLDCFFQLTSHRYLPSPLDQYRSCFCSFTSADLSSRVSLCSSTRIGLAMSRDLPLYFTPHNHWSDNSLCLRSSGQQDLNSRDIAVFKWNFFSEKLKKVLLWL